MTKSTIDNVVATEISTPLDVSLVPDADRWMLTLRRQFPQTPERLWEMLTDPAQLARWSPIVPDRSLTTPGPATCRENPEDEPIDAEVITVEPHRLLVHRWGVDLLRWQITPTDGGTLLELRQTFADRDYAGSYAAGWHVCFGSLSANASATHDRVVGQRAMDYGWEQLRDFYDRELETVASK